MDKNEPNETQYFDQTVENQMLHNAEPALVLPRSRQDKLKEQIKALGPSDHFYDTRVRGDENALANRVSNYRETQNPLLLLARKGITYTDTRENSTEYRPKGLPLFQQQIKKLNNRTDTSPVAFKERLSKDKRKRNGLNHV